MILFNSDTLKKTFVTWRLIKVLDQSNGIANLTMTKSEAGLILHPFELILIKAKY